MKAHRALLSILLLALACSSKKPAPGKMCLLNSDCQSPLTCAIGKCHEQCAKAVDCPAPATCINVSVVEAVTAGVCQLTVEELCTLPSDCPDPLFCAVDRHCRNQCNKDKDCVFPGLVCADHACALPADVVTGTDGMAHLKEAQEGGVTDDAGTDAATGSGGSDGGASDTAAGGSSGSGGSGSGGSGGTTDGGPPDAGPADAPADGGDGPAPHAVAAVAQPALVRQGAGSGAVMITVTATAGLSHATGFSLGGLTVRALAGATDTMLVLTVTVPHGMSLGKKTLMFTSDGGPAYATDVVEVSAITSGPSGMDTAAGTSAAPFRSLKQALAAAGTGDTVQLLDGTYDPSNGEDWAAPLPDGLTLAGQSIDGTILSGLGSSTQVLVPLGAATVTNLTAQGFVTPVHLKTPANVTLTEVALLQNTFAVYVDPGAKNSSVIIQGADTRISGRAIYADPSANGVSVNISDAVLTAAVPDLVIDAEGDVDALTLTNVTITRQVAATSGCDSLILFRGAGSTLVASQGTWQQVGCTGQIMTLGGSGVNATLTGTKLVTHGTAPVLVNFTGAGGLTSSQIKFDSVTADGDIDIVNGATNALTIKGSQLSFSNTGLFMIGALTLTGTTLDSAIDDLVTLQSGSVTARGSTFKHYKRSGINLQAGKADLGTGTDTGNNVFQDIGNGTATGIRDQRGGTVDPTTCSGTTFDGNPAPAAATVTGPASMPPAYNIINGESIVFY